MSANNNGARASTDRALFKTSAMAPALSFPDADSDELDLNITQNRGVKWGRPGNA
jgi:hypothetical protein